MDCELGLEIEWEKRGEKIMIKVEHVKKEFISPKKYPGLRGALKGLVSREKVRKVAVDDISFHIKEGEIVGYIGSNGAGKSTTIKMMTGILSPTEGVCLVNGVDPCRNRRKNAKNIGVVFGQRTQLWWDLPLSESFTILKEIYDVGDEEYKERMEFLNRVLGLEEFFSQPVRNLSLGQRMRADLGAALLHNPPVLYLDEPAIGQPDALGELLVGSILISISLRKGIVMIGGMNILLLVVSFLAGAIIYTAIKLLFASFAFWIKVSGPVLYTAYQLADFAKYPTGIYVKGVRFLITWIIPFAFVAYLPASYFLVPGVSSISTIGVECILAVVFFAIAYAVFTAGTRAYESAGN